ncbi:hypothetical protein DF033_32030 [Burkholderia cenocepacia]|nr:hypothetical protein DF033_32030 [Burkholderia cenocepacia]
MLTDETHQFADVGSRERALLVLDWLAWGEEVFAEWRAPVSGLLAGWPDDDVPENQRLEPSLQTQLDAWLSCALDDVTLLAGFSVPELREMFLQRTGTLRFDEGRPVLSVEREAIDILLHEIPWPLTQVALPWMLQPLQVEWM